ncbi:MAG: hypothetical protein CL624_09790 [Arcobacter sp.]|nr:hypothetical protein [Arcobacter sp.]
MEQNLKFVYLIYQHKIGHKIINSLFLILLYVEHEALILIFRVPQSVQKVKTAKFNKHRGIVEQKNVFFNEVILEYKES